LKEDALYYRYKSAADLALRSVPSKKEARLKTAIEYYKNFIKNAQKEDLKKEAKDLYDKLEASLAEINNKEVVKQ